MLPRSEKPKLMRRPNSPDPSNRRSRTCLIITIATLEILLLVLICLSLLRSQQHHQFVTLSTTTLPQPSNQSQSVVSKTSDEEQQEECELGLVYVYDLPPTFNQEILNSCDELNPWSSVCDVLQNSGFGKPAKGLAGIVPDTLLPSWYWTDQFVLEIIFHKRLLKHKCRTLDPESATAFYIPFYAGLAVGKHLWSRFDFRDRDRHCDSMLDWVHQQRFWNKSLGWDHFLTMGRITWDFRRSRDQDWGSSCVYMPLMRNITRLLIERNPWDYFDVAVPYPTGFHPRTLNDVDTWQEFVRGRNRSALFSFVGAKRGKFSDDFRSLLLAQCGNRSESSCRVVDCSAKTRPCSNGSSEVLTAFLDSDFCLQPRGDSFTRRSIFDCMIAGSIPVFFWHRTAYFQYEWFLPREPGSYSVFIDRNSVRNGSTTVKSELEKFSRVEVEKMREKVIEFIPRLLYSKPDEGLGGVKDAFDVAIDGVLKRIKDRETGYKWK